MNIEEYVDLINESANKEWFESFIIEIDFTLEGEKLKFEGILSLYEFVKEQVEGWARKANEIDLPAQITTSKQYFYDILQGLISFTKEYGGVYYRDDELNKSFDDLKKRYIDKEDYRNRVRKNEILFYDSLKTKFLLNVYKQNSNSFPVAFLYLTGNFTINNLKNKREFEGAFLACEFESKIKEQGAIISLKNDIDESLSDIERFKNEKEKLFSDWFINTKGHYEKFSKACDTRVEELEATYKEKLRLQEPANYWSERGEKLKKQGWKSLYILVGLVLIVAVSLGYILWNPPTEIFNSFFEGDKSAAIRWSIIYITCITFMAYCIKAVNKVMFSSFHLARDCEERYTLTYFYLSLLKDSSVTSDEKQLIMQSLFSRADTGLLKEDSSPTMPNDIVGKVLNKS